MGKGGGGSGSKAASSHAAAKPATAPDSDTLTSGGVHHGKFDAHERGAIDAYSGVSYNDINGALRGTYAGGLSNPTIAGHIKNIDSAIGKGRLAKDQILYRGIGMGAFGGHTPKRGGILSDKGFLSTSRSRAIANRFGGGQAILRIKAKKGTRAVDVSYSAGGNEQETLFGRGQKLKIKNVKTDKRGRTIISVETM